MNSNLLDDLLNRLCEKLQLDETRFQRAKQSYNAVTEWLQQSNSAFKSADIEIFPQGSFAIQTTVKPLSEGEYDLDFVLLIKEKWTSRPEPLKLLADLETALKQNDRYKYICEKKNRCVRINYKNDFHMDILPAFPNSLLGGTNIVIPDRELKTWVDSNPKGYISWFELKSQEQLLLERMASVQQITQDVPYKFKSPLKRMVQLIKRYRDIVFENEQDFIPKSIILTTLAGNYYNSEIDTYSSIDNFLKNLNRDLNNRLSPLCVTNPANQREILSESWNNNPDKYRKFKEFISEFVNIWDQLKSETNDNRLKLQLAQLFGEQISTQVINEQKDFFDKSKLVGKTAPIISIGSTPIKPWKS